MNFQPTKNIYCRKTNKLRKVERIENSPGLVYLSEQFQQQHNNKNSRGMGIREQTAKCNVCVFEILGLARS